MSFLGFVRSGITTGRYHYAASARGPVSIRRERPRASRNQPEPRQRACHLDDPCDPRHVRRAPCRVTVGVDERDAYPAARAPRTSVAIESPRWSASAAVAPNASSASRKIRGSGFPTPTLPLSGAESK